MRKIAFGYSTRCNIKCEHCVAADATPQHSKMELAQAKQIIVEMAELVCLCQEYEIYTRVVSNSFWAKTPESADRCIVQLKKNGLSQMRLSYSRWHQRNIGRRNIVNAAESCKRNGLDYFVSFVTDFSEQDDDFENYLREHYLRFFPEPVRNGN
ncbi:MAG: hypothetical protein U9R57_12205 [Thermodesulfobacteriota bacterium]|nr:hypothetical protein [Thermodesulfobacteriota bacterium]